MSPECSGCGGHVSHRYARVLSANDSDTVERCHRCSNKTSGKGVIRDE